MFRPLSLFVGLRYTRAKRRNHFISFISTASILGIMLGVATLITVLSVINGFDREFQNRILGMVSHANVWRQGGIDDWQQVVEMATTTPGVEAAAPFVRLQGMLSNGGTVSGVIATGIVPGLERKVSVIPQFLDHEGALESLTAGSFNMVLGAGIADKLGVKTGDRITLILPVASGSGVGVVPQFQGFRVSGVFDVGAEVDEIMAFVSLEDAQHLARMDGVVNGVRLKVADLFQAQEVSNEVVARLPAFYWAMDWTRTHGNLYESIRMVKGVMIILLLMIVVVAAFNIVSSLVMVVNDKRGDIAILRTLGATPRTIMAIFMVQGTFSGVVGVVLGGALGIAISLGISDAASWLDRVLQRDLFQQYFVKYLPSELRIEYVVLVVTAAFLISVCATIYPAWRATRVMPAEALRYE